MIPSRVDILIVGGGPVGATLALNLRQSGLNVLILEARAARANDSRVLAISYGSKLILERAGIWQHIDTVTPIEKIHVSQKESFGRAFLQASDLDLAALGYVIKFNSLQQALTKLLEENQSLHYISGATVKRISNSTAFAEAEFEYQGKTHTVTADLLALADGGSSLSEIEGLKREVHDYAQSAVVAQVTASVPHQNTAYERFTQQGAIALLPSQNKFALVWTVTSQTAATLCALEENEFLAQLQAAFGGRVGKFDTVGTRSSFPLTLKYTRPVSTNRLVVLGNAAQSLHPVAAQGLNLGLRDAWELGELLLDQPLKNIQIPDLIKKYSKTRYWDSSGSILATHGLIKLFSNNNFLLNAGRGFALTALDCLPVAKKFFIKKMVYGFGLRG
jgi:2-octaprenyl-6-methoxyphenol hydroxylase